MEEADVTDRLTRFAVALDYESLPREVIELVKLCIIDQVGVQLGLSTLPVSRIALEYATGFGPGPSTILGSTSRVPPEFAAFANGIAGHAFELDDMHLPSLNHPGPIVVSSALAVGEAVAATGKKLIEAITCGYEVMGRIGRGLGRDYVYGRGFHPVGVLGPIGSAIAAAKTCDVSPNLMFHALGLATSHGGGTLEYNQTWGETTRLHAGLAAMGGIRSAALARAGLTGPGSPIAGKYGFGRVHSDQCDFELMLRDLGSRYIVLHNFFKLRPYHGILHAVIDKSLEALEGMATTPSAERWRAIRAIRVGLNGAAMRGLAEGDNDRQTRGSSSTHLQFSLPVPLANAIVHGGTIDSVLAFDPNDSDVDALAQRVVAEFDQACEDEWYREAGHGGARICVRVRIELTDGQSVEGFGDPFATQRTPEQLYAKFRGLAGRVLPRASVEDILGALRNLEALSDVNELGALLRSCGLTSPIGKR